MVELALLAALVSAQGGDDATVDDEAAAAVEEPDPSVLPPTDGSSDTSEYTFASTHNADVGGGFTKVTALNQYPTPRYGWFPLVVHVDNTMGPRQTIRLSFNATSVGGSHVFVRSVDVGAGERRAVSLPVQSHLRYGDLQVRGAGITERGSARLYFNTVTLRQRAVLNIGTAESFQATTASKPSFSGSAAVQVLTLAPEEAPGELTPYVGWDAVVISGARLEQLTEAQRRALEEYAALGGHLVLMQGTRGLATTFPLLASDSPHYGLGELTFCEKCGLQKVLAFEAKVPVRAIEPKGRRNRYAYDDEGIAELHLPVAVAPIGRFLIIITLFTLAIGPGSLWVARRRGPAALLVTIPGTALLTCALIIGYSLLRDGFTVHGTVQGFTLLDSRAHRAVSASVGAFYANLAPGGARFADTAVVAAPTSLREYASIEQAAGFTFDDGARAGADFVPSRSYIEWSFLSVAPTRARLVVKQHGSEVKVQNALGAELDLVQLKVGDALYEVSSLGDGQEAVARHSNGHPVDLGALEPRLSDASRRALRERLKPNEFVAVMKGPGFTPLGGLKLEHNDSRHLVRGGYEQ